MNCTSRFLLEGASGIGSCSSLNLGAKFTFYSNPKMIHEHCLKFEPFKRDISDFWGEWGSGFVNP